MYKTERYDYTHQAWIDTEGRYLPCNHPPTMDCHCYGKLHAGELAPTQRDEQGSALTPVIAILTLMTMGAVLVAQSGLVNALLARLAQVFNG